MTYAQADMQQPKPEVLKVSNGVRYVLLPGSLNHLAQFPDDPIIFPQEFLILAAFNEVGELLGRTMWVNLPHIEGTQVREDMEGTRVAYNLVSLIEEQIKSSGRDYTWAFVQDGDLDVENYMSRLGYLKVPIQVWVKNNRDEGNEEVKKMIRDANKAIRKKRKKEGR